MRQQLCRLVLMLLLVRAILKGTQQPMHPRLEVFMQNRQGLQGLMPSWQMSHPRLTQLSLESSLSLMFTQSRPALPQLLPASPQLWSQLPLLHLQLPLWLHLPLQLHLLLQCQEVTYQRQG